ncbi:phage protein [Paenibacillus cisolokensis]|uniref:Phage protein n=1 Tax=Paenibacillus cisolokensis TaxID=1658519 RepID=A0ABQ4N646_9BACL|nr:ABC transporter ATP-binding protein [Paenibacillus cisolokensis]GIQ63629.1 phage protein [Paenibacillus cisolokensis]
MNFTRHRRAIERMYTDRATIYRHVQVKDTITKETKLVPQPVYVDQSCRISQRALGQNNQTEAQNEIRYETKLIIAPEVEIRQGDLLEVTRGAVTRKYTAGEPFLYSTHQEVSIQREEWA